jgi:hypothetical protein
MGTGGTARCTNYSYIHRVAVLFRFPFGGGVLVSMEEKYPAFAVIDIHDFVSSTVFMLHFQLLSSRNKTLYFVHSMGSELMFMT